MSLELGVVSKRIFLFLPGKNESCFEEAIRSPGTQFIRKKTPDTRDRQADRFFLIFYQNEVQWLT